MATSSSSPSSIRASKKRSNIKDREAILSSFRTKFFARWQSVASFMQAAGADNLNRIDKPCWDRMKKLSHWEELLEPFGLFQCLDVDSDGVLSVPDISRALAEVAPAKGVSAICQLFHVTGVHRNRDFSITRSQFATECATHLDIRPVDAEAFFDAAIDDNTTNAKASKQRMQFTDIARYVKKSKLDTVNSDLVRLDQADYEPWQSVWIQYSITRSFLGKTTLNVRGVGNDIPFPLTEKTLLQTPVMIAMIPQNAVWAGGAGGGLGFYDPEKNVQFQVSAVTCAPLPHPLRNGVMRLHAPGTPGKFKVGVFRGNSEKYLAQMVGVPELCTVLGADDASPDPTPQPPHINRLSLESMHLSVEPRTLTLQSMHLGINEPRTLTPQSMHLGINEPRTLMLQSTHLGINEPRTLTLQSTHLSIKPRTLTLKSTQLSINEPRTLTLQSTNLSIKPR
eukprot:EG_transcript_12618